MNEPEFVIYEECSSPPSQGSDIHKNVTLTNGLHIPSSLIMSSMYVSSNQNLSSLLPRTTSPLPQLTKESISSLSQSEILDSKILQDDSILSEGNLIKSENENETLLSNSYVTTDNGFFRFFLAPLSSCQTKNNSSEKISHVLLNSNLSISESAITDSLIDDPSHSKDELWTSESDDALLVNTLPSVNLRGKKNTSQVVVKLLPEDLNFDMVEIVSPHLDNSHVFEFTEKDSETDKISQTKEIDISSGNYRFITQNDNIKIIHQQDDIVDTDCNLNDLSNKFVHSEMLSNQLKKELLPEVNDSSVKDHEINSDTSDIFQQKSNVVVDKEKNKGNLKSNLFLLCLICSQECSSIDNLKDHYLSHTEEELADALLKCTLPIDCKNGKRNNTDQTTAADPLTPNSNNNQNSIMGMVSNFIKSKKDQMCLESNKENSIGSDTLGETATNSHSFASKLVRDLPVEITKSKTKSKSNKKKHKQKNKLKLKSSETRLKSRDPHTCTVCQKVLSSRGNLAKHLIQHETVKPWVCKECGAGFNSKRNHDHHYLQKHTTLRPNICSICSKGFTNKRTLTEHMVFHRKEKQFKCDLCNKTFSTKKCVNRHMLRHETKRKFVCNVCYKAFRVNVDLVSHLKMVHSSSKKKPKSKIQNAKSHSTSSNHNRVDTCSQNQNNTCRKKTQTFATNLEQPLSGGASTQQQIHMASNAEQLRKIKFSDLLQSTSNSLLPDISNEFPSTSLSEVRETLFISGESIDSQTIVPVPSSIGEQTVYDSSYGLGSLNKTALINEDHLNTYVMIGLSELQDEAQESVGKTIFSSTKRVQSAEGETEMVLLPSVIENFSRSYTTAMEEDASPVSLTASLANKSLLRNALLCDKDMISKKSYNINNLTLDMSDKTHVEEVEEVEEVGEVIIAGDTSQNASSQALNLDLLSNTFQLDFQSSSGGNATSFIC